MIALRTVYQKTLYDHRIATIAWGVGLLLIGLFYASIYPAIADSSISQAMEGMSSGFMNAFIGSADFFATPDGFIHGEFFTLTTPLIVGIITIMIASGLIAKEEESGTLELLLARPLARQKLLRQKALALITITMILCVCVWLGLLFGRLLVPKFTITLSMMAVAAFNLGLMSLAFGSVALMVTAVKNSRGLASSVAGIYFLLSYIVGMFGEQVTWLKHFEQLSLFHYFRTMDILEKHVHGWDFVVLIVVSVVLYGVAEYAFSRRDTGR